MNLPETTTVERTDRRTATARPHIVLIVPRGEALRNFVYSETLTALLERARVSLLTVTGKDRIEPFAPDAEVYPLQYHPPHPAVAYLRGLIDMAHFHYLGTDIGTEQWERAVLEEKTVGGKIKKTFLKALAAPLSNDPSLRALTSLEHRLHRALPPTGEFKQLFQQLKPDLVFNCSHIHGPAAEEPLRAARDLGIQTAGFIFSWDNLYSRGRIISPYDHYLVWNDLMASELRRFYPAIPEDRIHITGTPQFDFHFDSRFYLDRAELCRRIGIDPARPFVLYTTGVDRHFPEEHFHVRNVIRQLKEISPEMQLVVRTYIKGTSAAMMAIAEEKHPGVVFPPILWDEKWYTPQYEDLSIYTSLLRHCEMGINVASTVSLELLIHDKPVLNFGFDPPGSNLRKHMRFARHIHFDHYLPVAESGAVMVTRSVEDVREALIKGLKHPQLGREERSRFSQSFFGGLLDGKCGRRVADVLFERSLQGHGR